MPASGKLGVALVKNGELVTKTPFKQSTNPKTKCGNQTEPENWYIHGNDNKNEPGKTFKQVCICSGNTLIKPNGVILKMAIINCIQPINNGIKKAAPPMSSNPNNHGEVNNKIAQA